MHANTEIAIRSDMKFIGTTEAKVDSKGRVFLPAMFRRILTPASPSEGGAAGGEVSLIMRKDLF